MEQGHVACAEDTEYLCAASSSSPPSPESDSDDLSFIPPRGTVASTSSDNTPFKPVEAILRNPRDAAAPQLLDPQGFVASISGPDGECRAPVTNLQQEGKPSQICPNQSCSPTSPTGECAPAIGLTYLAQSAGSTHRRLEVCVPPGPARGAPTPHHA